MILYKYINENIDRLKTDIRMGIMSPVILRHWEIYSRYDYYRRTGEGARQAAISTSIDMRISERMIFHIIKKMEQETCYA